MILLREAQERDVEALLRFSQIPGMFNLPTEPDPLRERIRKSLDAFSDKLPNKFESKYMFVAEELSSGRVLGTSSIAAQHGTPESPHFYFEVGSEQKFSDTINTGFIHGTLKLKYDTNGPSELGGLVMDPGYRASEKKIGRQISFVRFLYLGLHRNRFKKKLIAELLPPLNERGQSPLWEAIGRRFTSMDYWEADHLCAQSKEFIFSLFPSGKIYTTFLTAEARNAIGRVGKSTEPVLHMLKKIGFAYKNQIDPFDGGPHLWANVEDLLPLKRLMTLPIEPVDAEAPSSGSEDGLITKAKARPGTFRAVTAHAWVEGGKLRVAASEFQKFASELEVQPGDSVAFMPYY